MITIFNKRKSCLLSILFLLFILNSFQLISAQNTNHFIALDSGGNLYDVDPLNCNYTSLNMCNNIPSSAPGAKPLSIAIAGSDLYIVDNKGKLWRQTYNSASNCTMLGSFSSSGGYFGLTVDPNGLIYAVTGTKLETYNPATNTFAVLGNMPGTVGGDLLFYGGELYMACTNLNLLHVNLSNLAASNVVFSFPSGSNIFGFSSVSVPCSNNQAYAISSSSSISSVFPLNMTTGSVGASCSLPFNIYDTASIAENGSYMPPAPPTLLVTQPSCTSSTATITISPVLSGYTYSFNGGLPGSTTIFTGLAASSSYSITATDASGCVSLATTGTIGSAPITVTPTFTQVAPICSGGSLSALPTTSNNGVTGTWSPTLNNTATTTYTFTPTTGQCANTQTMTISVNQIVTPTFTQVAPICSGDLLSALPTLSNNGITGTWSPTLNNTLTTTYTFTPTTGQCANTQTMTISVNQIVTPTFTQVAPICSGDLVSALPTLSNNGVTGTWSPALNNTLTTIYTFTPTPGQCANSQTMTISVNQIVTPTFNQVAPVCSGDLVSALPTTSINGITGTWSPVINNTATTTYTFTPTTGLCATTQTMTVTVNQKATPTFAQVNAICSGDFLSALPTTSINGITGTWSPAINNTFTTTYTFTPTFGICANTQTMTINVNAPNTPPSFTQVAPICAGDVLLPLPTTSNNGINGTWSPALNTNTTTTYTFAPVTGQCANSQTMTIVVNQKVTPTFTPIAPICSGDVLAVLPSTSTNGITGTWSPALNTTLTTTYTFTPTTGICANTQTMTIVVNQKVTPTFTPVAPICSGDVLATLPLTSTNGITGTWSPTINNTATTTYTFTPTTGLCANTQTMTIVVNQIVTPTFTPIAPICSGAVLAVLPTTSTNGITGTWSPALNNTTTTTYTFTPTTGLCALTQTMTIVVNQKVTPTFTPIAPICLGDALAALPLTSTNGITGTWSPVLNNTTTTTYTFTPTAGICANTQTMTLIVSNTIPTFTQVTPICSGDVLAALPLTSTNGITGTWSPALNNTTTTTYTFTPTTGQCASAVTMTIQVNELPMVVLENGAICKDAITGMINQPYLLQTGLSSTNYSFEWYFNGAVIVGANQNSYAAFQAGTYGVLVTNTNTGCVSPIVNAVVAVSTPGLSLTTHTTDYFADHQTIEVYVTGGTANYLYQLDDGLFQDSNVFVVLSSGVHTITVKDIFGCTYLTTSVLIIFYPHYFTPNGDGYNDTWKITGLENQPNSKVSIFDRFGKLLKQISTSGNGWDGTYNGNKLPSTDYWFVVDYIENNTNKQFKSHFAMKR
jgi:gliding motility-associated-like protein